MSIHIFFKAVKVTWKNKKPITLEPFIWSSKTKRSENLLKTCLRSLKLRIYTLYGDANMSVWIRVAWFAQFYKHHQFQWANVSLHKLLIIACNAFSDFTHHKAHYVYVCVHSFLFVCVIWCALSKASLFRWPWAAVWWKQVLSSLHYPAARTYQ